MTQPDTALKRTPLQLTDDHYMMTVNASNIDKDWAWVSRHLDGRVDARNVSEVARHGYPILHDGAAVGVVTSGSYGPSVGKYIDIGHVPAALAAVGSAIAVRGRGQAARVVKTSFHPLRVKR